jgi:hypothetical protein
MSDDVDIKNDYASIPEDLEAPPKLFANVVSVYNAMLKVANEDDETGAVIWVGSLTAFVEQEAGVAQSQYSRVIGTLREMQCIGQLRRGSGSVHSKWAMLGPPTYENYLHQRKKAGYRRERKIDPMVQRQQNLQRQLAYVDARIDRLMYKLGVSETDEDLEHIVNATNTITEAKDYLDGQA